jgi:hypothetical protein
VYGNPLRYIDPSGHDPLTMTLVAISAIFVVAYTAYLYTTPQMQELGRQAMAGIENAVQRWYNEKCVKRAGVLVSL